MVDMSREVGESLVKACEILCECVGFVDGLYGVACFIPSGINGLWNPCVLCGGKRGA